MKTLLTLVFFSRFSIKGLIVLFAMTTCLVGCNDSERDDDTETLTAREHSLAMLAFNGVIREVHRFALGDTITGLAGASLSDNGCTASARYNKTNNDFPVKLTVVYDSNECADDLTRNGQIRCEFSGKYLTKGSILKISMRDLQVDGKSIDGEIYLENLGKTGDDWRFNWEVKNGLVTDLTTNISWNGNHTLRWVDGIETSNNTEDDVFLIVDGMVNGRNSRGNSFTNEITSALTSRFDCKWFTQGRSRLDVANLTPRSLNYGEDECDQALIVRRNNTYFEVDIAY